MMQGCPEVENIALSSTIRMEALEEILAQVGREGALPVSWLTVDGARTTTLLTTGAEVAEYSQAFQDLLHSHLLTEECEVELKRLGRP